MKTFVCALAVGVSTLTDSAFGFSTGPLSLSRRLQRSTSPSATRGDDAFSPFEENDESLKRKMAAAAAAVVPFLSASAAFAEEKIAGVDPKTGYRILVPEEEIAPFFGFAPVIPWPEEVQVIAKQDWGMICFAVTIGGLSLFSLISAIKQPKEFGAFLSPSSYARGGALDGQTQELLDKYREEMGSMAHVKANGGGLCLYDVELPSERKKRMEAQLKENEERMLEAMRDR
uniref:Uncharacterized protein n=1 Tax=Chromera velia CCMP2878 TaxID=1169474 RepID=A0A0G4IBX9_9ALVE|eukprot:Cvel_12944.t1-p1 / transcript=Cvel_12944.t1 / gene=Cvel_12944 / organism=Chromera_velia_CCMP2878 / gene_product=hypothetical protein / transcript_product=hypothetical protein / location=Cvel_scaffold866:26073-27646(-) / protein_length=229 / sequence_SO=supercontig / SO=protein_coding / is_pseudo=false